MSLNKDKGASVAPRGKDCSIDIVSIRFFYFDALKFAFILFD